MAAGASSRLGKPKQLLPYDGQSLLQHALQIAKASNAQSILIVLGARAELLKKEIGDNTAHVVVNAAWEEGMASSIRCGIRALMEMSPTVEAVILMVCDQPYVTAPLLNDLIAAHQQTGKPIATCSYENTFGPPTLFHKHLFPELLQLEGDVGARSVIRQHANEVEIVLFPKGSIDVDTGADYEKLTKMDREP
ncbi:MAG: nucleotidyltransferase family protein [Flavisolibacter sp.]|nr:nucleotidyltransferase family protein [Flavisolibacter sp.]